MPCSWAIRWLPIALAAWLGACGDDGDETRAAREQGSATVGGDVVSTVDGMPITSGEVQRVASETELSPPEALERLQERELLAGEALRRGYGEDPAVERATRQALVQQLLAREVEDAVPPESITEDQIRARYETRAEEAAERGITLEDAREEIREQLLLEARRERHEQLVREIEERWPVERNAQAIDRAMRVDLPEGP